MIEINAGGFFFLLFLVSEWFPCMESLGWCCFRWLQQCQGHWWWKFCTVFPHCLENCLSLLPPFPSPAKPLPSKQLWAEFLSKMNLNFHMLCGTGYTNTALRGSQLRGASPESLQVHGIGEPFEVSYSVEEYEEKKLKMHAKCFS